MKLFRVPVHEVAMMMSIALRFIPILLEETDKIMKAQIARGADFESGNLIHRASLTAILTAVRTPSMVMVSFQKDTSSSPGVRNRLKTTVIKYTD